MTEKAFFISPDGALISTEKHISTILEFPEKFGFSREQIEELYKKHNEKIGTEGKAREEIVKQVINKGWIRIRKYEGGGNDFWSVNVKKLTKAVVSRLETFAEKLKNKEIYKNSSMYDEIRILEMETNEVITMSAQDIIDFKLYQTVFKEDKDLTYYPSFKHYLDEKKLDVFNSFEEYLFERSKSLAKNMILERIR